MHRIWMVLLVVQILFTGAKSVGGIFPHKLTCNYQANPLGVNELQPVLSWQLQGSERGEKQTAYRIMAASSPEKLLQNQPDLWDTGKKLSAQSIQHVYQGKPLKSRNKVYWRVMVWDKDGEPSAWSNPGHWEMALLNPSDWQAIWLQHPDQLDEEHLAKPAPFFRKEFNLKKPVRQARAYVTGLGYFTLHLNGAQVGDHVLDPVKTRYDKTVNYLVHDITGQVQQGPNAIGLVLGTGWYNHFAVAAWQFSKAPWRDYPTMICQLEITYTDGSMETIISDASWKASTGPILFDGIRNGETYDARLEMPGWDQAGFNDRQWKSAVQGAGPTGKLVSQFLPPIRETRVIEPVSVTEIRPGVYVFDLGQNISGYSRLQLAGPAGAEITLKHGERLFPDGSVEQKQILRFLRTGEAQTDRYILKGVGVETWSPRFVYHGYQYVEVSGLPTKPTEATLQGVVIHTAFDDAGSFSCSNPLFNRLQELTRWSFIGNYHGIPTDCPHREKIGWTGDAQLVTEAGLYNYEAVTSYIKWLDDFVDEQREDGELPGVIPTSGWGYEYGRDPKYRPLGYGPQWEGAFVLMPWDLYRFTADTTILQRYYQPILKYMAHLDRNAEEHLLNFGIDDHKAYYTHTGPEIIASGYYYHLTELVEKIATILGDRQQAQKSREKLPKIREAFNKRYFNAEEASYGNGGQTSLSEALYFGLVPEGREQDVLETLMQNIEKLKDHFDAGVVGVKFLFNVLDEYGQNDLMYRMVNQRDFPSYGWWVEQGANTLWQDWDGSMSHNHVMFGTVSEWYFESLAGIKPDNERPGFQHVIIEPAVVDSLDYAAATYEAPQGTISVNWNRKNDKIDLKVTVPVNASASVVLPVAKPAGLKEGGKVLAEVRDLKVYNSNGRVVVEIGSGHYDFELPL